MTTNIPGLTHYINSVQGDNIALKALGKYARESGDTFNARLAEKLVAANNAKVALAEYQSAQRLRAALEQHGIDPATYGV